MAHFEMNVSHRFSHRCCPYLSMWRTYPFNLGIIGV